MTKRIQCKTFNQKHKDLIIQGLVLENERSFYQFLEWYFHQKANLNEDNISSMIDPKAKQTSFTKRISKNHFLFNKPEYYALINFILHRDPDIFYVLEREMVAELESPFQDKDVEKQLVLKENFQKVSKKTNKTLLKKSSINSLTQEESYILFFKEYLKPSLGSRVNLGFRNMKNINLENPYLITLYENAFEAQIDFRLFKKVLKTYLSKHFPAASVHDNSRINKNNINLPAGEIIELKNLEPKRIFFIKNMCISKHTND